MQRDTLDLWWGGLLALLGLFVAAYAGTHYEFGTPRQMGPGFFPVALGVALALLGVMIAVPAWNRRVDKKPFAFKELVVVSASLLLFAVALDSVGLILTTAATSLLASSVAPRKGVLWRLVLTVVITALTFVIFSVALKMSIPVWPRGLGWGLTS